MDRRRVKRFGKMGAIGRGAGHRTMSELREVKLAAVGGREMSGDTKFGGIPQFIQGDYTPDCCGQKMALLAQLDGLDYKEAELPDSALVYVWLCRRCFDVRAAMQHM
jgi:hypothetical protein